MTSKRELNKLAKKLTSLDAELQKNNKPVRALLNGMRADLQESLDDLLTGVDVKEGGENNVGELTSKVEHHVGILNWRGNDICFLEYGTGLVGAKSPYPDQVDMMEHGYAPRPTGHRLGEQWVLPREYWGKEYDDILKSSGWKPYMPMYNVRVKVKTGDYNPNIEEAVITVIKEHLFGKPTN